MSPATGGGWDTGKVSLFVQNPDVPWQDRTMYYGDRPQPMQRLFEAIEAYFDAVDALGEVDDHAKVDEVVENEWRAAEAVRHAMEGLVPTDDMARWPWEDHYGEPDPIA